MCWRRIVPPKKAIRIAVGDPPSRCSTAGTVDRQVSPSTSRDAVGRVVQNRYRLVAKVGAGPSTMVYLADDVRLRRRVSVTLLAESLADEPGFVGRFSTEMVAVAALRHPHVGIVHDWGIEGAPFVVGEYLVNGTLRSLVDRGVHLSVPQALALTLGASRALAYAHAEGVIHRALEPGDIGFAEDGRMKITGFGLARALAEAASTEPMGIGMYGVRYASPEQASGRSLDGRSDVYSLVLMMIEAVTGDVPLAADTVLSTLMARVDRPPEVPESLGVLRDPFLRATTVDPNARLDADGLATALMAVADLVDEPEPIAFEGEAVPAAGFDEGLGGDDITRVVGPTSPAPGGLESDLDGGADQDAADVAGAGAASSSTDPDVAGAGTAPSSTDPDVADVVPASTVVSSTDPGGRGRARRRWRVAWSVFALVVVVGGAAVGYLVWQAQRTPTHLVPSISGLTPANAQTRLEQLGFRVETRRVRRDGTVAGQLLGVNPRSGRRIAEGDTVRLVVSAGRPLVEIPSKIVGVPASDATATLTAAGFAIGPQQQAYSEDVPQGRVIASLPAVGQKPEKGSTVSLVVSRGPRPRVIPQVGGMTPAEAEAALRKLGLIPQVTERYDKVVDKGGLIGLQPGSGSTVPRGAQVTVVVSKGLVVAVPGLDGVTTLTGAIARLQQAGLVPGRVLGSGQLTGRPVAFDPASGTLVAKGAAVDIVVQ